MKLRHRVLLLPVSLVVDAAICLVFLAFSLCTLYQFMRRKP